VASLLFLIRPAFAQPDLYQPPSDWARVCRETAVHFYVEAIDAPHAILPGETLPLVVSGYGLAAGGAAVQGALLVGDEVAATTAVFPITWPAQTPITFTLPLAAPPDEAPARARLLLYLDGQPVELGWLKIAPRERITAVPAQPLFANFADEAALLGYDLQEEEGQLRLTTYWQALRTMTTDYTLFVHLLGADGTLIAQQDGSPQDGRYPTSIWDVGEVVVDEAMFSLPPDVVPAQIAVGLYRLESLERLALRESGETAVFLPFAQN
jgi:hypothetical protein